MDKWNEQMPDSLDRLMVEFPRIFEAGRPMNSHLPPGWLPLVREMLADVCAMLADGQAIEVQQIKEKFGGLRFYWSLGKEHILIADIHTPKGLQRLNIKPEKPSETFKRIDQCVEQAEDASLTICERCGRPGTLDRRGWWKVNCDRCRERG
jgi:hypothetical protein